MDFSLAFREGWQAGMVNAVALDLSIPQLSLTDIPINMRTNPYDRRTTAGKDWHKGFGAAMDAAQGQFYTIYQYYKKDLSDD